MSLLNLRFIRLHDSYGCEDEGKKRQENNDWKREQQQQHD